MRERVSLGGCGHYEFRQELGGAALDLGQVEVVIVGGDGGRVEAVVVAVGEGEEGEAGDGDFVGDAAVEMESDEKSDMCAHGNESLGELKSRVYVAL